jgi:hypothetical protein
MIIIMGFVMRLIIAIWNGFFDFDFGQVADPGSIHGWASYFSKNPTISNCEENIRHVISCVLGYIYFVTTDSMFVGSLMSVLVWCLSAFILLKIMNILLVEKSSQRKTMLVYALLPSSVIITSVTLREPYQLLFVNLAVFAALKIYWDKSLLHWLTMFFAIYFMSFLHAALIVFGIYILISALILQTCRRYASGLVKLKLAFVLPFLVLIVVLGVEMLINIKGSQHAGYGELSKGLGPAIQNYQNGGIRTALQWGASTTYRDTVVDIKSDSDLIFFIPTALFSYLFEPMPWRASRPQDMALLLENLLRAYLIWIAWAGFRKVSGKKKNVIFYLIISYFALETIWAQGTMNWGTAARHHIPGLGILVLSAFAYSKPRRLKSKPLTSVNDDIIPGN